MKNELKPTAIDLFSGCGGLTLGLKQAGFDVKAAVEVSPIFNETYRLNHPEVRVFEEDISTINISKLKKEIRIKKGKLHLLAGCPPCQGFSTIGKKDSLDKRNDLVFEFLRFVKELMPKTVMMENVPGLLKDHRIDELVRGLKRLGYDLGASPVVLDAAEYGVPQRRKRLILIGSRVGRIEFGTTETKRVTVKDAIAILPKPGNSGDPIHDFPERRTENVLKRIKLIPRNGGSFRKLDFELQLDCHKKCSRGFKDIYGRMKWDEVSPTITGGCTNPSKGRFLHPSQNRAITLREAALLQSFPIDYKFSLAAGKTAISLMIGNALPPQFIKYHASVIRECLKKDVK